MLSMPEILVAGSEDASHSRQPVLQEIPVGQERDGMTARASESTHIGEGRVS
jgi:hypothetical protein